MFNRAVTWFNNLFVVWVILAGVAAFFFPKFFLFFGPYNKWFFALTMFGVGMSLHPDAFKNIFHRFWQVMVGVAAQFTIMPLLAFGVAWLFAFDDNFTLGLILTGSAPGAMASNVLSYLAGADVAYSVSLTTCSTLLAPVLTPLLTLLLAHVHFKVPFFDMFLMLCLTVVLPLLVGIMINKFMHKRIEPVKKIFPAISTLFIVFICALVIAKNREFLPKLDAGIFAAAIILNLLGLIGGYLVGMLCRFDLLKKRALSIEIGMQNAGLGSVLALNYFNEKVALPAIIFVFICIFSAAILVPFWSRSAAQSDVSEC
jgi:BASS family bile acid:Na+ symporter